MPYELNKKETQSTLSNLNELFRDGVQLIIMRIPGPTSLDYGILIDPRFRPKLEALLVEYYEWLSNEAEIKHYKY